MKSDVVIYHNPLCGKSRAMLELLRERGIEPRVIEYLKEPPDATELRRILKRLGLKAHEVVRRHEPIYQELGLSAETPEGELIEAIIAHPILLERPIVVVGERAAIGRPPEKVLGIL